MPEADTTKEQHNNKKVAYKQGEASHDQRKEDVVDILDAVLPT
jgi:hypothetical protein